MGTDGGERGVEHSCEGRYQDIRVKWGRRRVGLRKENIEARGEGEDVDTEIDVWW